MVLKRGLIEKVVRGTNGQGTFFIVSGRGPVSRAYLMSSSRGAAGTLSAWGIFSAPGGGRDYDFHFETECTQKLTGQSSCSVTITHFDGDSRSLCFKTHACQLVPAGNGGGAGAGGDRAPGNQ